jgi:hypothetical protein
MPRPEKCRREDCTRPRSRLSVFCDGHHKEELVRIGLKTGPHDPRELAANKWRRCVDAVDDGSLSTDEGCSFLLDTLLHAVQHGASEFVCTWLNDIPVEWVDRLILYSQRNPHPRLFHPLPETEPQRYEAVEKARVAYRRIIEKALETLDDRSRDFYFRGNAVGYFKEDAIPVRAGTYRYEPYHGPGHVEMVEALRENGSAKCWYYSNHRKVSFAVVSWSGDGPLVELAHFSALDCVAGIEPS